MSKFDRQLFEALLPKGPNVNIVTFTGSKAGDVVHLKFGAPLNFDWISDITEDGENEEMAWFVDEGRKLPPGISNWRHKHIVRKIDDKNSEIIDDITFNGPNPVVSVILYPAIFIGFLPRKRIYRSYFNRESNG